MIKVTVIYALPEIQYILKLKIKSGSTIKDAILMSKILNLIHCFSIYKLKVGIFNKIKHLKSIIKDGDQIEIYRNLIIDPKERRRKKIIENRSKRKNCKF